MIRGRVLGEESGVRLSALSPRAPDPSSGGSGEGWGVAGTPPRTSVGPGADGGADAGPDILLAPAKVTMGSAFSVGPATGVGSADAPMLGEEEGRTTVESP
jgi:hypothetical protein